MTVTANKPSAKLDDHVCATCLHVGALESKIENGTLAALFGLGVILRPLDLILGLWLATNPEVCPACHAHTYIPVDTRRGRRLVELQKQPWRAQVKRFIIPGLFITAFLALILRRILLAITGR